MVLISRHTGLPISDFDHMIESITTRLTTYKSTRTYRRGLGAGLLEMLDSTITKDKELDLMYYIISDLRDETRLQIDKITISDIEAIDNKLYIDLHGVYLPTGQYIKLEGLRVK